MQSGQSDKSVFSNQKRVDGVTKVTIQLDRFDIFWGEKQRTKNVSIRDGRESEKHFSCAWYYLTIRLNTSCTLYTDRFIDVLEFAKWKWIHEKYVQNIPVRLHVAAIHLFVHNNSTFVIYHPIKIWLYSPHIHRRWNLVLSQIFGAVYQINRQ